MLVRIYKFIVSTFCLIVFKASLIAYPVQVSQLLDGRLLLPDLTIDIPESTCSFQELRESIAKQVRVVNPTCNASELILILKHTDGTSEYCENQQMERCRELLRGVIQGANKLTIVYGGDACSLNLNASHKLLIAYDTGKRTQDTRKVFDFLSVFAFQGDTAETLCRRIYHLLIFDVQSTLPESYADQGDLYLHINDRESLGGSQRLLLDHLPQLEGCLLPLNFCENSPIRNLRPSNYFMYFGVGPGGPLAQQELAQLEQRATACRQNEIRLQQIRRRLTYCNEYYLFEFYKKEKIHSNSPLKCFKDFFFEVNRLVNDLITIDGEALTILGKKRIELAVRKSYRLLKRIEWILSDFDERCFDICTPIFAEFIRGDQVNAIRSLFTNDTSFAKFKQRCTALLADNTIAGSERCFKRILKRWRRVFNRFNYQPASESESKSEEKREQEGKRSDGNQSAQALAVAQQIQAPTVTAVPQSTVSQDSAVSQIQQLPDQSIGRYTVVPHSPPQNTSSVQTPVGQARDVARSLLEQFAFTPPQRGMLGHSDDEQSDGDEYWPDSDREEEPELKRSPVRAHRTTPTRQESQAPAKRETSGIGLPGQQNNDDDMPPLMDEPEVPPTPRNQSQSAVSTSSNNSASVMHSSQNAPLPVSTEGPFARQNDMFQGMLNQSQRRGAIADTGHVQAVPPAPQVVRRLDLREATQMRAPQVNVSQPQRLPNGANLSDYDDLGLNNYGNRIYRHKRTGEKYYKDEFAWLSDPQPVAYRGSAGRSSPENPV